MTTDSGLCGPRPRGGRCMCHVPRRQGEGACWWREGCCEHRAEKTVAAWCCWIRQQAESTERDRSVKNYFLNDSNFWCVQSSITHSEAVHVPVLWPVCAHDNSIPNVVASLTIHDNTHLHLQICTRHAAKRHETIVEGQRLLLTEHHGKCLTCKSFVKRGFWWHKTNRTIRWLIPFKSVPQES